MTTDTITRRGAGLTKARPRGRGLPFAPALGLLPFAIYITVFLGIPAVLAVLSGFQTKRGAFTLNNLGVFTDPKVLATFGSTIWLAAVAAIIGAILGVLICLALLGLPATSRVRTFTNAATSVLAQFGGVTLAFAFIATVGRTGLLTQFLDNTLGINIVENGVWLYSLGGLVLPYVYFSTPLMVITFMPALAALKPQWAEANLALGGTRLGFWRHIGIPVLAPSFFASLLLLFAGAFSAYATAAALVSQGAPIVPIGIENALTSESVLGRAGIAGVYATGMILVVVVVMFAYARIQQRAERWQR
ncbi:MAG TPA: ABC transporter permease subunit [Candidatus Lumbricidophila sp.]|nr:ABC transporter permease subunit [Candidatus Lumbricidophila sp.]